MLHKTITARVQLKKIGRDLQRSWHQDELIGGKLPVEKKL
jgi:hypothetical protein